MRWGKLGAYARSGAGRSQVAQGADHHSTRTGADKFDQGDGMELAASVEWAAPIESETPVHQGGPVMIQVTYEVAEADRARFITLMHEFAASRRRNGGYGWSLMQDGENRNVLVETWQEPSWLDHLRHHERVTGADQRIQEEILALHHGKDRPFVRHLVAAGS